MNNLIGNTNNQGGSSPEKLNLAGWWVTLILGIFAIDYLLAVLVTSIHAGHWIFYSGLMFIILIALLVVSGIALFLVTRQAVPQNEEWLVEINGKYIGEPWKAGLHHLFPFFMEISGKVFMGDQPVTLFVIKNAEGKEEKVKIEFQDGTAPIDSKMIIRIKDSFLAVYGVRDLIVNLKSKIEECMRSICANLEIEKALEDREKLEKENILNCMRGEDIFERWGTELVDVITVDILLPPEIEEMRNRIVKADKEREVAEKENQVSVKRAEGAKSVMVLEGEARGEGIKKLADASGLEPKKAADFVLNEKYFEAIGDKDKLIISSETGQGAPAFIGAQIAAASSITNQVKP